MLDREAGHGSRLLFAGMVVRVFLVSVAALLLGGCGGTDDEPAGDLDRDVAPRRRRRRRSRARRPHRHLDLADHRDGVAHRRPRRAHAGYDRVVFEFGTASRDTRSGTSGRPILADGSGEEVAVAGGAVLVVRMEPALDADLTQESAPRTYTGPTRFSPGDGRGRRARPHRRIRGRPHVGGRCRREAAVPGHAARGSGADRDRHRLLDRSRPPGESLRNLRTSPSCCPLSDATGIPIFTRAPSTGHLRLKASRATDAKATVGRGAGRGSYRLGAFSLVPRRSTTGIGRVVRRA